MKMNQILAAIRMLSHSQGFYGRLYRDLMTIRGNSPEQYDAIVTELEAQKFGDAVDMVLYFEC